jgi:hypothetical protein
MNKKKFQQSLDIINETIFKAEIKVILLYVIVKIKTMA